MNPDNLLNTLHKAGSVWRYSLFEVQNNPVTFGKFILALVMLVAGYLFCNWFSKRLVKSFPKKIGIEPHILATVQRIVFYVSFFVVILVVLNLLEIPLTALTVVGGAFAIGIGFGLKNIISNFMSGIILLVERPIRVSDFIEVEGILGTVETIGFRSTQVKAVDNTHIVVPNSTFLENKVLNWTLSDDIVRSSLRVGVAYSSRPRQVEAILSEAIKDHERIIAFPTPSILFSDFGDNALLFDVYYWAKIKNKFELLQIESELRFKIFERFRDNEVVIAFPQRDIHFDGEIPIRLERAEGPL